MRVEIKEGVFDWELKVRNDKRKVCAQLRYVRDLISSWNNERDVKRCVLSIGPSIMF